MAAVTLTTLRGTPVYSTATPKFGTHSFLGDGTVAFTTPGAGLDDFVVSGSGTIECWIRTTNNTSLRIIFGHSGPPTGDYWLGLDGGRLAGTGWATGSNPVISDGAWHHVAIDVNAGAKTLYVDGTATQNIGAGGYSIGGVFCLSGWGNSGASWDWIGNIDELRISTVRRYTANFTPPATPLTVDGSTAALYHLDGDATPAVTLTGVAGWSMGFSQGFTDGTAPSAVDLTVAGATQAQTAGAATITVLPNVPTTFAGTTGTVTGLTSGQSYHVRVRARDAAGNWSALSAPITVTATSAATALTVASADQAQTAAAATLTQTHALSVDPAAQAQTAAAATLTQVHALAADPATHAQTSTAPALTQVHSLAAAGATQAHTAGNAALTQTHALAAQGASQDQTVTAAVLAQIHSLAVDSAAQAQTVDNAALTSQGDLVVDGATHAQTVDSTVLEQQHQLAVDNTAHAQSTTAPALAQVTSTTHAFTGTTGTVPLPTPGTYDVKVRARDTAGNWSEYSSTIQVTADANSVTLAPANAAHAQTVGAAATQTQPGGPVVIVTDEPGLELAVVATSQDQTAAAVALAQTHSLVVQAAAQDQTAAAAVLAVTHQLAVDAATQTHTASSPVLLGAGDLETTSTAQAQTAQNATLTQVHSLTVDPAAQAQTAGAVALTSASDIVVQSTSQAQTVGATALGQVHNLAVASAEQMQTAADAGALQQLHQLAAASTTQAQTVEAVVLVDLSGYTPTPSSRVVTVPASLRRVIVPARAAAVVRVPAEAPRRVLV